MFEIPNYGRTSRGIAKIQVKPKLALQYITKQTSPMVAERLILKLPPSALIKVSEDISSGRFNLEDDITQFSALEQQAIKDALQTGDQSALQPKHIAWIERQVSREEEKIREIAIAEEIDKAEVLDGKEILREQALKEEKEAKLAMIEKAKAQQRNLYIGVAMLGGLGLFGAWYFGGKK